jgi:hypothetical protein
MFEDMFLMSRCRNFILANSSFSWWAAFLGQKENSITVAPEEWFREGMREAYAPADLYPPSWILI